MITPIPCRTAAITYCRRITITLNTCTYWPSYTSTGRIKAMLCSNNSRALYANVVMNNVSLAINVNRAACCGSAMLIANPCATAGM